ncbi:MAG: DNA repair protein RecO, partial [Flavobacteriaceae bacterium]|nr:DNA repair protein RecO [Flavobacteriaceae bacterium]
MLVSTPAVVLSSKRYRDSDLIVTCFTRNFGRVSYILKGILKSRKGKLRPAFFQPFTLLDLEANHKDNRSLQYIKEARISHPLNSLHSDQIKRAIALFLSEVLYATLKVEEKQDDLFDYIETTIKWFETHETYASFHIVFLLELTKYLGFYPDVDINHDYFDLVEGRSANRDTGLYSVSGENLTVLKEILGIKFDRDKEVYLSMIQKRNLLDMILLYFKVHLDGFKEPKSLT